jgi:hypothetical protein
MRCLKLTVALAVLFSVLAHAQCVARCTVTPCRQSATDLPPCHRHSSPGSKPCTTPLFVSGARFQAAHQLVLQATIVESAAAAPAQWQLLPQSYPASPPPDSRGLSNLILRI